MLKEQPVRAFLSPRFLGREEDARSLDSQKARLSVGDARQGFSLSGSCRRPVLAAAAVLVVVRWLFFPQT